MTLPSVLGLSVDAARERLRDAGIECVQVQLSGRRREGQPRVIRVRSTQQGVALVATCIKAVRTEQPSA